VTEIPPAADLIRKQFTAAEIKAESERTYLWTISTGAVDRDNDTIKVSGWDTDAFLAGGGPVLWAHRYDQPPIGKSPWVRAQGAQLKARVEFAPEHVYPFAETVRRLVDFGAIRATSVGFRPKPGKAVFNEKRGGYDFEEQELLEFSIVPVPANPQALLDTAKGIVAAKAAGMDVSPIRSELVRALEAAEGGPVMVVPEAEWRGVLKSLGEPRIVVPQGSIYRHVGSMGIVTPGDVTKRGRTLSAANEASIRSAHAGITAAAEHLGGVLSQVMPMEPPEDMPMDEEDEGKSAVLILAPSTAPQLNVTPEVVKAAVVAAVTDAVVAGVNRARGRLD